jgi:hypothetical protein
VFGPEGLTFGSQEAVKAAVLSWFQQHPREFFVEWIHQLVRQWDACLSQPTNQPTNQKANQG